MKADVRLSTRFTATQNAHSIALLVAVEGEMPVRRAPINIALVLDRSGSMDGAKLHAAREAAARFASFLSANDRLSVVTFDDQVRTIYGPAAAGAADASQAIQRIQHGGSTNLSGGWLQGYEHVRTGKVEGVNRVVLFTDGLANVGLTDPSQLRSLPRGAADARVSTSCIGFGDDFSEDLLRDMAQAGHGNFWYIERLDQMAPIFDEEIEGLVALAAQNVRVGIRFLHPGARGVSLLQQFPVSQRTDGSLEITLGDLYATSPRLLGMSFDVTGAELGGNTTVAEVTIAADIVKAGGIEHRVTRMPVIANLDGTSHADAKVDVTFLRFEAAQARDEAIRRADDGDLDAAAALLEHAAVMLRPHSVDPLIAEEALDLREESRRMRARLYEAADRKYHRARALSVRDAKQAYAEKISRRRRPELPNGGQQP